MNKYALKTETILADNCFAEIGRPTGLYWSRDKSILAIASTFDWVQWAGRDLNTKLKFHYRVGLYDAKTLKLIKVFDSIKYPINHIDFYPDNSILAIATGSYDGGYCFEGELLFWDIKRDKAYSHIRENREVTTCKFSGDGGNLFFVLRPPFEEDDEGNSLEDTFFTYETHRYFDSLFIKSINETTMKDAGIAEPYIVQDSKVINETLYQLAVEQGLKYENRLHVWDVCMLNESELFATSNINCIEKWSINGALISAVPGKENSKAIEIISPVENDYCLVNIEQRDTDNLIDRKSVLYKWDIKSDEFSELIEMDFPASISTNTNGDMLARDVFRFPWDKENTLDFVIDRDYNTSSSLNLGRYDIFNHYIRVNGADRFYFIQGTPASSHKQKWICSLEGTNKEYSRLFSMEWDSERNSHMFSDGGCYCKDSVGEALIIASRFYSPNPSGLAKDCATIVRRNLPDGRALWNRSFDSQITSMLWLEEHSLIAVALTEGRICILSSIDGKLVLFEEVKIHGVDNVIMSMSCYHNHLVAGTVDGRIICYQLINN